MRNLLALAALAASTPCCLAAETPGGAGLPELTPQLEAIAAESAKRFPEAVRQRFAQGIAEVRGSGILERAAKVGDKVPVVKLVGPAGETVTSDSLWRDQPVVLTFYRGGWCPYCNTQLRALQQSLDRLGGTGAKLVAVTPELPEFAKQTASDNRLTFTVLTDPSNRLARELNIAFRLPDAILPIYKDRLGIAARNGDERYELPLAATYIVDTEGVIRYAFLDADYKKRAEPAEVLETLLQLFPAPQ